MTTQHDEHDVTMAEVDKPKIPMIVALVITTVVALIITVAAIVQFFDINVRREVERKVNSQPSQALLNLHAQEEQKLNHYGWVNEKAGVVHIPVEQAMELTLKEWEKRPEGLVEVKDNVPPAPTPAPAAPSQTTTPPGGTGSAPAPAADPAHAGTGTSDGPAGAPAKEPAPGKTPGSPTVSGGKPASNAGGNAAPGAEEAGAKGSRPGPAKPEKPAAPAEGGTPK